jgi:hypothetical protein
MARTALARPDALGLAHRLERVQTVFTRLINGSLSTLAALSALGLATHPPHYALFAALATAIGDRRNRGFPRGSFRCAEADRSSQTPSPRRAITVPTPSSAWVTAD